MEHQVSTDTPTPPQERPDVRVALLTVTPEKARQWLKRNENNRSLSKHYVSRYASLMRDGEWMISPDAIAFDTEGRLINGQHRLTAVIQADAAHDFIVARGLDPKVFLATDGGKKRQAADALDIEGYANYSNLAAVARRVVLFEQGRLDNSIGDVETHEIVSAVKRLDPSLPEAVNTSLKYRSDIQGWLSPSNLGFVYFVMQHRDEELADEFLYKVATGLKIEREKDPARLLRDRLQKDARTPGGTDYGLQLAYVTKAANYYFNGTERTMLRWSPGAGEEFPVPDVLQHYPFPDAINPYAAAE